MPEFGLCPKISLTAGASAWAGAITRQPIQRPIPCYIGSFSQPSIELAARLGCNLIVAPFAAAMTCGGLREVGDLYRETCLRYGRAPGRVMCSYFIHFADNPEEEAAARARQMRYYNECVIAAFPGDPRTAPPSYRYFVGMVKRLRQLRPQDLTDNSVLLGNAAQIGEALKKVEAAGIDEVILYFNVGLKPHVQVKDEMARFMTEIAPPSATAAAARSDWSASSRRRAGRFALARHSGSSCRRGVTLPPSVAAPRLLPHHTP